ncbi:UNVERIFIED_CONTAM: hypothetical protein GTU68_051502, partial [Idotea baltica]|nr:hypothetical protein [Idotea baltica]
SQIEAYLQGIAAANPDRVTTTDIGKSYEGRSIWMVTIKDGTDPTERSLLAEAEPSFFSGIHAREWISPAVALYFIDMLIKHPEITNGVEFRIFPVLNPDGYVYSHTDERLWRKNRRINSNSNCRGVDLNRNWSYEWGGHGSSSYKCSNTYRGTSAFSEPETIAVSNAMLNTPNVKLVLSIHNYSQLMLYPYGYDYVLPPLYLRYVAIRYTLAIEGFSGYLYVPEQITDLFRASGTTTDWAFGSLGAKYAYAVELRDTGDNAFILPSNQIKPTREENWEGFKYLIQIVKVA